MFDAFQIRKSLSSNDNQGFKEFNASAFGLGYRAKIASIVTNTLKPLKPIKYYKEMAVFRQKGGFIY